MSRNPFDRRMLLHSYDNFDDNGEDFFSQPGPVLRPLSQAIATSNDFLSNICQPRHNGPLVKMLNKSKTAAYSAGSTLLDKSSIRKTYRILKQRKSPQGKSPSCDLRSLLDSISSAALTASSAPQSPSPSDLQQQLQNSFGTMRSELELRSNTSSLSESSHCAASFAAPSTSALSPAVSRRLTPRSSRKAKQACHQPSPLKLGGDFQLQQPAAKLMYEVPTDEAAAASAATAAAAT